MTPLRYPRIGRPVSSAKAPRKSIGWPTLLRDNRDVAGSDGKTTLASLIVAAKHQVSTDLAGEKVLLDTRRGRYFALSGVGTTIWQLIGQPTRVKDICDRIVDEYEVELEQCRNDVLELVDALADAGLIEVDAGLQPPPSEDVPLDRRLP